MGNERANRVTRNIGQPEIPSDVAKGQASVIDSKAVDNRRDFPDEVWRRGRGILYLAR